MGTEAASLTIFGSLIFSVVIAPKININAGIIALVFAFFLGVSFFGQTSAAIIAFFPTSIVLSFIMGMFFFGYVRRSGIFSKFSQWVIYAFRGNAPLLPIAVALCSTLMTAMGCNVVASTTIMAPIAYTLATTMGYSPFLACVAIWSGTGAGAFPHLILSTAVARSIIEEFIGAGSVDAVLWYKWLTCFLLNYGYIFLIYFLTGAPRTLRGKRSEAKRPEAFSAEEKKVLAVLLVYIFFMMVPPLVNIIRPNPVSAWCDKNINTYVLFGVGSLILNGMHIAPAKKVLQEDVSWELIMMISGTTMLLKLLTVVGTIDMVGSWIGGSVPHFLIIPLVFLCGAVMTIFTNANVALQTLAPLFFSVVSQVPEIPAAGTFVALWIGSTGPTIAPFSTGGALALMMCPEELKDKQMKQQLIMMFVVTGIGLIVALSGWYNWMNV